MTNPNDGLYPEIEPYSTGRLRVSDLHELYYEEAGNPDGKPAVFLHGGPGRLFLRLGGLPRLIRKRVYLPSASGRVIQIWTTARGRKRRPRRRLKSRWRRKISLQHPPRPLVRCCLKNRSRICLL